MRLFVAIELPDNLKKELAGLQSDIKKQNIFFGNYVSPINLQLDLRFIGEVNDEKVSEIKASIKKAKFEKFKITPVGLGILPNKSNPRVLFAAIKGGNEKVAGLHNAINDALAPLGFEPDMRFEAHITLLRVKQILKYAKLQELFDKYASKQFGSFEVSEIVLMKSTLTPKGPVYEILERFNLG